MAVVIGKSTPVVVRTLFGDMRPLQKRVSRSGRIRSRAIPERGTRRTGVTRPCPAGSRTGRRQEREQRLNPTVRLGRKRYGLLLKPEARLARRAGQSRAKYRDWPGCIVQRMPGDPPLNNPAGRLYSVLGVLRSMPDQPISQVWKHILGAPGEQLGETIGAVARLVPQIDAAVQVPGRERQAALVSQYRQEWLTASFPLATPFNDAVRTILPSDAAYLALGGIADYLAVTAPDGVVPDNQQQEALLELLQATIEAVTDDNDLPREVAHLILQRLSEVEAALRHVEIGGPLSVKHATEALMGAVDATRATNDKAHVAMTLRRVFATAGVIWTIFTGGGQIQPSLEAWEGYAHELTPAYVNIVPPSPLQIGSGLQADELLDGEVVSTGDDGPAAT